MKGWNGPSSTPSQRSHFSYDAASHDTPAECAVCLSEFVDKELGRDLPNCNHCFHIGCIDMWLYSRSNCPLCRAPVTPVKNPVGVVTSVGETSGPVDRSDYGLSSSSSSLLRSQDATGVGWDNRRCSEDKPGL